MKHYFVRKLRVEDTLHSEEESEAVDKLFLCTEEEIRVGDIVKERTVNGLWIDWEIHTLNDIDLFNQLKVVGEITPDALWLKDGDVISEEDVQFIPEPLCPKCNAICNDGFCPEEGNCYIRQARTVVLIKGPCGHFH